MPPDGTAPGQRLLYPGESSQPEAEGPPHLRRAAEDGLVVKRAGKDRAGTWQFVSDNPNKQAWPTVPWPPDAPVIGEVKWAARTFV